MKHNHLGVLCAISAAALLGVGAVPAIAEEIPETTVVVEQVPDVTPPAPEIVEAPPASEQQAPEEPTPVQQAPTPEVVPAEPPAPEVAEPTSDAPTAEVAPAEATSEDPPAEGEGEDPAAEEVEDETPDSTEDLSDTPADSEEAEVVEQGQPAALVVEPLAVADPVAKVTFCHSTDSETNPFVRVTTSVSAFFNAGHNTHQQLRDVVPPFTYVKHGVTISFPGMNWTGDAGGFLDNGCEAVVPLVATADVSIVAPSCTEGELLILGDTTGTNASWGAYVDLVGPEALYTVVSTADVGYAFAAGPGVSLDGTTKTFTGSLVGPLDPRSPQCLEIFVATASISIQPATCTAGEILLLGDITGTRAVWADPAVLEGPLEYSVTSVADLDAEFAPGEGVAPDGKTMTFEGTLAGPLGPGSPGCQRALIITSEQATCTQAGSYTLGGEGVSWTVDNLPKEVGTYTVVSPSVVVAVSDVDETRHELVFAAPTGCAPPQVPGRSTTAGLASTGLAPASTLGLALIVLIGGAALLAVRQSVKK